MKIKLVLTYGNARKQKCKVDGKYYYISKEDNLNKLKV